MVDYASIGWSALTWFLIVAGGLIVISIFGSVAWWALRRRKWNLRVEVKLPRSDGQIINSEKAKGHYDADAGIVDIKRKRMKTIGIKPFDVKKYLQGSNYLEVIQVGAKDYIPVLPKSYLKLKDKGKEYGIMEIEAQLDKRRTWKNYFERAAKDRFTIYGFLNKHWRAIEISIIVFIMCIGFSILWMKMPTICG